MPTRASKVSSGLSRFEVIRPSSEQGGGDEKHSGGASTPYPLLSRSAPTTLSERRDLPLGASSSIFPIIIATHDGAREVKRELVWSAQSMGVSRLGTARKVVLPAALPAIFNSIQIALFLSFVVAVVAEMVTAGGGLGQMLTESVRFFQISNTIAAVITIAVIGLGADLLFRLVRRQMLQWSDDT